MKHIIYLFLIGLCFSSCMKKKDWECSCDVSSSFYNGNYKKSITQKTQSQANSECTDYGKSLIMGNGTYKCSITAK